MITKLINIWAVPKVGGAKQLGKWPWELWVASAQGQEKRTPCSTRACTFIVEMTPSEHLSAEMADKRSAVSAPIHGGDGPRSPVRDASAIKVSGRRGHTCRTSLRLHPGSVLSAFYAPACGFLPTSTINMAIYGWRNLHKIHRLTKLPRGIARTLWLGGSAFKCTALRSNEAVGISSISLGLHFLSHLIKVITVQ